MLVSDAMWEPAKAVAVSAADRVALEALARAGKTPQKIALRARIVLDAAWSNDLSTQLDLERDLQRQASLHPDYAEGVRAFMDKRPPAFSAHRGE